MSLPRTRPHRETSRLRRLPPDQAAEHLRLLHLARRKYRGARISRELVQPDVPRMHSPGTPDGVTDGCHGRSAKPRGIQLAEQHVAKTYDAIVVGSGACGSWAALELTRAGLQVLMLEAGANVDPSGSSSTSSSIRWTIAGSANRACCGATRAASGTTASCSTTRRTPTRPGPTRSIAGAVRAVSAAAPCTGRAPPIAWPTTSSRPRRSTATA